MNKELEEAKKFLNKMVKEYKSYGDLDNPEFENTEKIYRAIETVLQALENYQEENIILKVAKEEAEELLENSIPRQIVENKLKELDKEEQEAQDSISDEEREEYSDASIGYLLADIETRRRCYKELLEG